MAFLLGTAVNDTLTGTLEGDFILALEGNDTVLGLDADDQLNGNIGNDTVSGGSGNDLARGGKGNDQVLGELGFDTVFGDMGDDLLFGNSEDDVINGNMGNDTISGGQGNDIVRGGQDNDLVAGDFGDDFLYGDRGIDTLTGGDGKDIFFLRKGIGGATVAEADIITDYVHGADKIGLIEGLTLSVLNVFQGSGNNVDDTIIQDAANGQFLAVLKGVNRSIIDATDFINPGTLAFGSATFQVNEDGTPVTAVTVTRTDGSDGAVSVTVIPSNGTATAPNDYNNMPVAVNFAAGETSKTVTIPIVDDLAIETDEIISLSLSNATNEARIGAQNAATLSILNNDVSPPPKLTFLNPTPNTDGQFGYSVAAVGNNVLIGAPGGFTNLPGAAYLFDGTTGALLRTFLNPTPDAGDAFGTSVAFVGNKVLIGATSDDVGATNAGAAYLFDDTTGTLLQTFLNPNPISDPFGSGLGSSVAAVGDNVLIGVSGDDSSNTQVGAAYLFNGTTGALLQTFRNPTPDGFEIFGASVLALGNNALVWGIDRQRFRAQGAYLFDSTTGSLLRDFFDPTPNKLGFLAGSDSLAVVGNNVIVGASGDDTGLSDDISSSAGAAYLFDGLTGALLQSFFNPTPNEADYFGSSVAAVGNNVLIGASFDDIDAPGNGVAYLFNSTGTLLQTFLNPTPSTNSNFGASVESIGNNVLIGAPGAEGGGAVYLF